jgi:integrase/recombinase XerD
MKIERHGQAKILTQQEIELLFNEGLLSERDRTLFGVCLSPPVVLPKLVP